MSEFDGLVALITGGAIGTVADNDDEEWQRVLDVNVIGIARVTRAALAPPASVDARSDHQRLPPRSASSASGPERCTAPARVQSRH
jgi:NAD(P)-dependent dehydrogenase (short-subunit alcohol dehydrogenase family)